MKNVIKKCLKALSLSVISLALFAGFSFVLTNSDKSRENTNTASALAPTSSQFFNHFTFSSEGIVYDENNFAKDEYTNELLSLEDTDSVKYVGALYANTNVTLHLSDYVSQKNGNDYVNGFTITAVNQYTFYEDLALSPNGKHYYPTNVTTNIHQQLNDNTFVFKHGETPVIQSFLVTYNVVNHYKDEDGKPFTVTTVRPFKFCIIQTAKNYHNYDPVSYSYKPQNSSSSVTVTSMKSGVRYQASKIDLKIIDSGTPLNPVYIHFIKNGESFIIYNINGVFYNDVARDSSMQHTPATQAEEESNAVVTTLNNSTLPLDQAGIYEIEIHDRAYTFTNSNTNGQINPNANFKTDSFLLETDPTVVYLTAEGSSGIQIAHQQPTNDDVSVTIYNMSTSNVESLTLTRYSTSTYKSKDTVYKGSDLVNNTSFLLNEDYVYTFKIKYLSRLTKEDPIKYKTFEYTIPVIKGIRTTYTTIDTNEIISAQGTNSISTVEINQDITVEYGYGIKSHYVHKYNVSLANSSPSISGINDGDKVNDVVNIKVRGVGKITVRVYMNGSLQEPQVVSSGTVISLANAGDYRVEIIDEMNTIVAKNFTIGVHMNTATIALLIVFGILAAFATLFIIRRRSKVSVK